MSIFRISKISKMVKNAIGKIGEELRIYVFEGEKGLCGMKREISGERTDKTGALNHLISYTCGSWDSRVTLQGTEVL